ncbi:hypothetical protein E7Z59_05750 [Robertkochia marina]|uniref:Uncharacterized protein n=1 Tax=Robertkochia marina TaxID=1227945 RepID=A0A4S3M538_9FLAO|nr:hypothetical protein [Robertkochia marina]THD69829.1 hypothetical protein E7Z59_05750 [Robertkochia marina]TRZ46826.1 hypothetical protein D3A96_04460 [Robertkochia marina]
METLVNNANLHFEHKSWLNEIAFWLDETRSFQNRLDEIEQRWTDDMVLAELGQFQNQMIIHKDRINKLKEEINAHEHAIAETIDEVNEAVDRIGFRYHLEMREKMTTERVMFHDLKRRFFSFLSKYM